ncbi:hypothetical protein CB1_001428024 [Camelus ferus]|nr:hypothetical protein CB1_001428024 [Camelus ferus]
MQKSLGIWAAGALVHGNCFSLGRATAYCSLRTLGFYTRSFLKTAYGIRLTLGMPGAPFLRPCVKEQGAGQQEKVLRTLFSPLVLSPGTKPEVYESGKYEDDDLNLGGASNNDLHVAGKLKYGSSQKYTTCFGTEIALEKNVPDDTKLVNFAQDKGESTSAFRKRLFKISDNIHESVYSSDSTNLDSHIGSVKIVQMEMNKGKSWKCSNIASQPYEVQGVTENDLDSLKAVTEILAPIKALCSQRFDDWKEKFGPIGLNCKELTGDTVVDDLFEIQHAHIIMTTPEKWDSMTRKWRDNSLVQLVRLFLIDEVHVIKDENRGPTLEVVFDTTATAVIMTRLIGLDIQQKFTVFYLGPKRSEYLNTPEVPMMEQRAQHEVYAKGQQREPSSYQDRVLFNRNLNASGKQNLTDADKTGKEKKGGSTGTVREAIPEDKYKSNDDSAVLPARGPRSSPLRQPAPAPRRPGCSAGRALSPLPLTLICFDPSLTTRSPHSFNRVSQQLLSTTRCIMNQSYQDEYDQVLTSLVTLCPKQSNKFSNTATKGDSQRFLGAPPPAPPGGFPQARELQGPGLLAPACGARSRSWDVDTSTRHRLQDPEQVFQQILASELKWPEDLDGPAECTVTKGTRGTLPALGCGTDTLVLRTPCLPRPLQTGYAGPRTPPAWALGSAPGFSGLQPCVTRDGKDGGIFPGFSEKQYKTASVKACKKVRRLPHTRQPAAQAESACLP